MATATVEPQLLPAASPRRRWRMPWSAAGLAALLVLGVGLHQYPVVASWVSQYYQSQLITQISGSQVTAPAPELAEEITRARAYNELLVGGALVAANTRKPISDAARVAQVEYSSLLRATPAGVMARLRIPAIAVDLPVYHGTDDETLTKGVGHLEGTSLPVGGASQHAVLTAHRGLPEATLFDDLNRVDVDDTFTIEVFGEVLTYRVFSTQVVEPDETQALAPLYGRDLVTLVTCTPLGINTHRILVTGERVIPTPLADVASAGAPPEISFPWWAVVLGGAGLGAVLLVWRSGYARPRRAVRRGTGRRRTTGRRPPERPRRTALGRRRRSVREPGEGPGEEASPEGQAAPIAASRRGHEQRTALR